MLAYSNNYRGAPNGWSNICLASFLVGENSTGKSSYGLLIKTLMSSEFQFSNELMTTDLKEYDFNDYYSKLAIDNDGSRVVTIGFLAENSNQPNKSKDTNNAQIAMIVSYVNDDGEIGIDALTIIDGLEIKSIRYNEDKLYFTSVKCPNTKNLNIICNRLIVTHNVAIADREVIPELPKGRPPSHLWTILFSYREDKSISMKYTRKLSDGVGQMHAFAPVRSKPERVYFPGSPEFDSEGLYSLGQLKETLPNSSFQRSLQAFGKASGLFENIELIKLEDLERGAFSIKFVKNGSSFFSDELGFGVNQVVPLVVDILTGEQNSLLYIEQPELHLHPRAQAAFGDLLFELYKMNRRFLIETHSDYIIDRFRVAMAKSSIQNDVAEIKFFYNYKNTNKIKSIKINNNGSLGEQPKAYRKFFLKEQLSKFEAL